MPRIYFHIKFFIFLAIICNATLLNAEVKYSEFMDKQIILVKSMHDVNITKKEIETLVDKQEKMYENSLYKLMSNKDDYLKNTNQFDREIISLKKVISINKRAGNNYAVLRDEIALKSYALLKEQNGLIRNILFSLDELTVEKFKSKLNEYITNNQISMQKYYEEDFGDVLKQESSSKILIDVKKNINEFYILKEINADLVSYLYTFENKMFRLNKYSKYNLIPLAIVINSMPAIQSINDFLETYGLTVLKIFVIFFLIVVIFALRKLLNRLLAIYIVHIDIFKKYSQEILGSVSKSVDMLIIFININMVIYVYNDFSSFEPVAKFFNIIYGFFFTFIIYKIINTIASIKLTEINAGPVSIKNDLVNVSIKIVNFIIVIIGLLIMMFFAGVNLTAVLSGLGIGGFAVAFAAKDTISNFFGTLSILFSDVFAQGDWIEIDGHEGVVVEIGLRVTTIRTFDNALIAIPNGTFASKEVKNWNKRILGRRIKMSIGIKYDSKTQDIKNAINEIRSMLETHSDIATKNTKYEYTRRSSSIQLVSKDDLQGVKNTLLVYLDEFSDSSINILVYCFTKSVRWEDWLISKEDVMHKIMEILEKNSLEFAFPSLSIYKEPNK